MSLRGRGMRLLVKWLLAPRFQRAGRSVPELRGLADDLARSQKIPAGTDVREVSIQGRRGEWVCAQDARLDRAVLYLHGGAFVAGSPSTHRELAALISAAAGARVLALDYRLAPENPFPAALEDVVSAHGWLLRNGYGAGHLAICGDSAGGGLALQTLIALRDQGDPTPAVALLMSPVTDWVRFDGESFTTRAALDPLITEDMCRFTASLYVADNDRDTPLLYPIGIDLAGLPPLCIHVGDHEVLLSDAERLAERARTGGVVVDLKVWPRMWHVFQSAARIVPEARRSLEQLGRFADSHMHAPGPGG